MLFVARHTCLLCVVMSENYSLVPSLQSPCFLGTILNAKAPMFLDTYKVRAKTQSLVVLREMGQFSTVAYRWGGG